MTSFLIGFAVPLTVFLYFLLALFLLFYAKGKKLSNRLLGLFFLSIGLVVSDAYLQLTDVYTSYPQFAFWFNSLPFVFGPLLFFYTKSYVLKSFVFRKRDLWHFTLFLLSFLSFLLVYHFQETQYKLEFLKRARNFGELTAIASSLIIFLIMGIYVSHSLKLLRTHRGFLESRFSDTDKYSLSWISHILYGFLGILLLTIGTQSLVFLDYKGNAMWVLFVILLFVLLGFVIIAILRGLQNSIVFEGIPSFNKLEKPSLEPELDLEQLKILENLKVQFEVQNIFLKPDLKLEDLAESVDSPERQVSYVINNGFKKSFFDLVNSYRIKHIQKAMEANQDKGKTVIEFMYEAGFNSKSSFNTAFKKHTGKTPTQWRKRI